MIATKISNRGNQIPQARPADRWGFRYKQNSAPLCRWAVLVAKNRNFRRVNLRDSFSQAAMPIGVIK